MKLRRWFRLCSLLLIAVGCSAAKPTAKSPTGTAGDGAAQPSAATNTNGGAGSAGRASGAAGSTISAAGGASGSTAAGSAGAAGGSSSHGGAGGVSGQSGADGAAGSAGTAGATGSASASDCSRDLLKGVIDKYFTAMAAHDPTSLPQASTLKFTENTMSTTLGSGLVWKTAGMVKFTRSLLDTERCGSVTEAVIPNSGTDTIFGLRLKLESQKITEVETIVVDPNSGFFPTPAGIINSKSDAWEDILPADQRSTREQLEAAGKAYFASFGDSSVKVPYATPCDRLENGFKTTQGDCSNFGTAGGINQPAQRYPVSDLEAGITAGFVLFAGADIDFHLFKVVSGKIPWINAVVGPASTSQGWP